jgi:hypothetical protein
MLRAGKSFVMVALAVIAAPVHGQEAPKPAAQPGNAIWMLATPKDETRAAIQKLLKSSDAEVRKAATDLLDKLDKAKAPNGWQLVDDGRNGVIRLRPAGPSPAGRSAELVIQKNKEGHWIVQEVTEVKMQLRFNLMPANPAPAEKKSDKSSERKPTQDEQIRQAGVGLGALLEGLKRSSDAKKAELDLVKEKLDLLQGLKRSSDAKGPQKGFHMEFQFEPQKNNAVRPASGERALTTEARLNELEQTISRMLQEIQSLRREQGK